MTRTTLSAALLTLVAPLAFAQAATQADPATAVENALRDAEARAGLTPAAVQRLQDDADYARDLLRWDVLHRLGTEGLATLNATPGHAESLNALLDDEPSLRMLLDSGPTPGDLAAVLDLLFTTYALHTDAPADAVLRDTAIAGAIEGVRRGYGREQALARTDYYLNSYRDGRLNMDFATLAPWERRFIAYGVQHGGFNEIESLTFCRDYHAVPAQQYTGICWRAPYRGHNEFGDSIQRPHFYKPYRESYASHAEMVDVHGGVCGSLSNFGAIAAQANGVPAVTMGEPGHCAYAVRVAPGQWQPSYSLHWKRGLHISYDLATWQGLQATAATYAPDNAAAHAASTDRLRLASRFEARGADNLVLAAQWDAVEADPLHLIAWRALGETLKARGGDTSAGEWKRYHDGVLDAWGDRYAEIAANLLQGYAYPPLIEAAASPAHVARLMASFYAKIGKGWGAGRWEMDRWVRQQMNWIGDESAQRTYVTALARTETLDEQRGPVMLPTLADLVADKPVLSRPFFGAIRSVAGRPEASAAVNALASNLLPRAAAAGDAETFNLVGQIAESGRDRAAHLDDVAAPNLPGVRLSDGGTFHTSSNHNRWDNCSDHWGVIQPTGGGFHTDHEADPYAQVMLGRTGRVAAVRVVTRRGGFQGRQVPFAITVSNDGENWTEVYRYEGGPQTLYDITLDAPTEPVQYLRFQKLGGGPIHLRQLLVFGTPAR